MFFEKDKCTGCGACAYVCPVNCITMVLDESGFLFPSMNGELCIGCDLCKQTCPVINEVKVCNRIYPIAYAARHKNKEILSKSTSGGMFTAFSEKADGIIFGAELDDEDVLYIKDVKDSTQFHKMRGSKYVQSITGDSYIKVKQYLQQNKRVLYFALPCQIAGLRNYLNMDYDNLLCIDLVCHGCPSTLFYRKYVEFLQSRYGKIEKISHTDDCWNTLIEHNLTLTTKKSIIHKDFSEDFYLWSFLQGYSYRPYCYECKFAKMPRNSDITIGDFFGYGVLNRKKIDTKYGISQVVLNTDKGKKFFESLNNIEKQLCRLDLCMFGNHNLWKASTNNRDRSKNLYQDMRLSYEELENKYMINQNTKIKEIRKYIRKKAPKFATLLILLKYYLDGTYRDIKREMHNLDVFFEE